MIDLHKSLRTGGVLAVCMAAVLCLLSAQRFLDGMRADVGIVAANAAASLRTANTLLSDARPVVHKADLAVGSVASAAAKWEQASDAQIENLNKTGEDTRRTIAHLDRLLTNEVQPALANLKAASAEVPAAITAITGTADAATSALNATKKPMDALDGLLRDQEHGVPKLIVEANGTLEETHATAGNFEVWSEKLTHPASVIKQWFYGLLDLAWKGKTLAK